MMETVSMLSGLRGAAQLEPRSTYGKPVRGSLGEFKCLGCSPEQLRGIALSTIKPTNPPPEVEYALSALPNEQLYGTIGTVNTLLQSRGVDAPAAGGSMGTMHLLLAAGAFLAGMYVGRNR